MVQTNNHAKEPEMVTLSEILRSVSYLDYYAARKRFQKFCKHFNFDINEFKADYGNFQIPAVTIDFWVEIIKEMEQPYLRELTSNRIDKMNSEDYFKYTNEFHARMSKVIENISDQDVRESYQNNLELIDPQTLINLLKEHMEKVRKAGELILSMKLDYEEHLEIMAELSQSLDNWLGWSY